MGHHSAPRKAARSSRDVRPSWFSRRCLNQNRMTPLLGGTPLFDEIPSFIKCLQSQHVSFKSHLTSPPEHRLGVLYHVGHGTRIAHLSETQQLRRRCVSSTTQTSSVSVLSELPTCEGVPLNPERAKTAQLPTPSSRLKINVWPAMVKLLVQNI